MPRFRLSESYDPRNPDDDADDLHDEFDRQHIDRRVRRPAPPSDLLPRVVAEGKSGHQTPDVDLGEAHQHDESPYSSYDVANRGPAPTPDWLVTSLSARDTRLGVIKSGKEADVGTAGAGPAGRSRLPAGGQDVPRSPSSAVPPGRRLSGGAPGAPVPGDPGNGRADRLRTGVAGRQVGDRGVRRLAHAVDGRRPGALPGAADRVRTDDGVHRRSGRHRRTPAGRRRRDHGGVHRTLARPGGHPGHPRRKRPRPMATCPPTTCSSTSTRCVVIDLPQVVDLVANPSGAEFLERDCRNIAEFFARRGVLAADAENLALRLAGWPGPESPGA